MHQKHCKLKRFLKGLNFTNNIFKELKGIRGSEFYEEFSGVVALYCCVLIQSVEKSVISLMVREIFVKYIRLDFFLIDGQSPFSYFLPIIDI